MFGSDHSEDANTYDAGFIDILGRTFHLEEVRFGLGYYQVWFTDKVLEGGNSFVRPGIHRRGRRNLGHRGYRAILQPQGQDEGAWQRRERHGLAGSLRRSGMRRFC